MSGRFTAHGASYIGRRKFFTGFLKKTRLFMSKDFDQVTKARKRGRKRKPRMWKWEREIERVGTRVYAARLLLRFQGIESHFTPEQIAKLKAVANLEHDQEIGATNG